jgi:hypothetical protein
MGLAMQQWPANELTRAEGFASTIQPGALEPGLSRDPTLGSGDPTLRSVLFLAVEPEDRATDAVRDTALDLGAQAVRPVLLLDLTIPGNRHYRAFAEADLLLPRRRPPTNGPPGWAVLQFEQVRNTRLFVSRVSPDPSAFIEKTWAVTAQSALERLHRLFGAIVVAGPELSVSSEGLRLASAVDGVVMVLRSGMTSVSEAREMRDRVLRAGGQLMGAVLTGCSPRTARNL